MTSNFDTSDRNAQKGGDFVPRRFTETHLQRGYTAEQMRALLEQAGLNVLEIMDSDTGEAATATSERVYIVAKEQQKELPTERYVK